MSKKYELVNLKELVVDIFIRTAVDWDYVQQLADLIAAGTELIPIKVTPGPVRRLVEGRHRKEAYEINDIYEVRAEIVDPEDDVAFIVEAFESNYGGAKPPTREDIQHTIELLLSKGASKRSIPEKLRLPLDVVRKYLAEVTAKQERTKLQRAASAVTDGNLTVPKAAEQYGVDVVKLKGVLYGSTRRKLKQGIAEQKRLLSQTYRSLGQRNCSALKRIVDRYDAGDATERQVRELFDHIEHLQKKSGRTFADHKERFEALVETKKSDAA